MSYWSYLTAAFTHPGKTPSSSEIDIQIENNSLVEKINEYRQT